MKKMENVRTISDQDLMARCQEFGKKAREWKNRFVALLPEVARRGLHRKKGFATVIEFAAKIGGVGKSTVEAIFRIERALADKPELKAMVAEVGVNKIRAVASIATKENEKELVELVQKMSKPALELFAREKRGEKQGSEQKGINFEQECNFRPGTERRTVRKTVSFGLDKTVEFKLRKFKQGMGGEKVEWNDVIKVLLEKAVETGSGKISKKTKKVVRVEKLKTQSRPGTESSKLTRYIAVAMQQNFSEKCEYPGCNMPAQVTHHPERFALNPNHNNLKRLCKAHHELIHNGFEPPEWNPKTHPIIEQKFLASREY